MLCALSLTALCLPLSIAATNGALALLTLAVLLRLRGADRGRVLTAWKAEPVLAAVAVYVAAGLLSGLLGDGWAKSLHDSLKDSHRLWSLSLFVAALALEPSAQLWPQFGAGFALAAAVGIGQALLGLHAFNGPARAHAFVHPVTFGDQTALAALGGLCWLTRVPDQERRKIFLALAVTAMCAAALVLSQTRAALLAFGVGAVVVGWLEPRARLRAALAVGLGGLGAAADNWVRYDRAAIVKKIAASGDVASTISGPRTRYILGRTAWRMFLDHPWTGVGPGHYLTEFPHYFTGTLEWQTSWASAHNLYLQQLAERGLLGETVLLALLALLLVRAWRAARAHGAAASLWAAAAVPAFLVMNVTETAWQTEQLATLFLLIWALGTAPRAPGPQTKPT